MTGSAPLVGLDLATARRWVLAARQSLAEERERIDALNVFPVPDGDTGTNLLLTLDGAVVGLRGRGDGDGLSLADGLGLMARGTLLSARGNSGVILSQLVRGVHEAAVAAGGDAMGPQELADAFQRASRVARSGVSVPVEGTILTVARAAADAAGRAAAAGAATVHEVSEAALAAARQALRATPTQLPVLAAAGVVDAGGAGLVVVLEALVRVLQTEPAADGRAAPAAARAATDPGTETSAAGAGPAAGAGGPRAVPHDHGEGSHEVMYVVSGSDGARAATLRAGLSEIGRSVLVVGGPDQWRVHAHVDDPDAALRLGEQAGSVDGTSVTSLAPPDAGEHTDDAGPASGAGPTAGVAVVACASGDGLTALLTAAGAVVVRSVPGARASTGELLDAVRATGRDHVLLLPNDPDTVMTAEAAAEAVSEHAGVRVHVVPSQSPVQALAALALLDERLAQDADEAVAVLREAVRATRRGSVTRAVRDSDTPAGPCRAGDALGLVDGRVVVAHPDRLQAAREVLASLVTGDVELLTIVVGAEGDRGSLRPLLAELADRGRGPEVHWVDGGQPGYPWLFGAE